MTPKNRAILISSLLTGAAAAAGTFLVMKARDTEPRRPLPVGPGGNVIRVVTPVIYPNVAGAVLSRLERLAESEPITIVLHTLGGCAVSSVMIAEAVRRFEHVTAVVPYMALSGGTIIALAAGRIELGKNAALSAVDPMLGGVRARHIPDDPPGLRETANEYEVAIRRHVRESLELRLGSPEAVDHALDLFMGLSSPHEWPIRAPALRALGLEVAAADRRWADYVDATLASRQTISLHMEEDY
ncbi:MAG: hypothetical protein R3B09_15995 [Nannocystaceae bacterium]